MKQLKKGKKNGWNNWNISFNLGKHDPSYFLFNKYFIGHGFLIFSRAEREKKILKHTKRMQLDGTWENVHFMLISPVMKVRNEHWKKKEYNKVYCCLKMCHGKKVLKKSFHFGFWQSLSYNVPPTARSQLKATSPLATFKLNDPMENKKLFPVLWTTYITYHY